MSKVTIYACSDCRFGLNQYDPESLQKCKELGMGVCFTDYDDSLDCEDDEYYHDYGPCNPWDAPGMCMSDFI